MADTKTSWDNWGMLDRLRRSLAYWGSVLGLAIDSFIGWGIRHLVGFLIAAAILGLQIHYGVFTTAINGRWLSIAWPYLSALILGCVFHVARAAWQKHEDVSGQLESARKETEAARDALTAEQRASAKLTLNGPQPWIGWERTGTYTGFTISNQSADRDAEHISIVPTESESWILGSKSFPRLGRNVHLIRFETTSKRKSDGVISDSYKPFVSDIGLATGQATFCFTLKFCDAFGNDYERDIDFNAGTVSLGIGDTPDIKNRPIRVTRPPLQALGTTEALTHYPESGPAEIHNGLSLLTNG